MAHALKDSFISIYYLFVILFELRRVVVAARLYQFSQALVVSIRHL
jgi:hypothetical protein